MKKCLYCNKFSNTSRNKYCSRKCFISDRYKQTYRDCFYCNKKFRTYPCEIKIGRGKHCSHFCATEDRKKNTLLNPKWLKGKCIICNNEYHIIPNRKEKGMSKFCSTKCAGKHRRGKRFSPQSEFKKDPLRPLKLAIRNSSKYNNWRRNIFERDNWTCQMCRKRGGKLNADHIKPFALYPELRMKLSNGRTLCVECHKQTDTYGSNTKFIFPAETVCNNQVVSENYILSNPSS